MLVSISLNTGTKTWVVVAQSGELVGRVLGECEAINLKECQFKGCEIYGHPTAIYGAVLDPDLDFDSKTLRGLGINKVFANRAGFRVRFDGESFVSSITGRQVASADFVTAFRTRVDYRE